MTNANDTSQLNDWNKLAREALDLWEGHLSSLASDPKAKEDMAKFISPMSGMFEQWAAMMQQGLQGASPFTASTQGSSESSSETCSADDSEEPPYTVWQEEMIMAAKAAAASTAAAFTAAPSTPVAQAASATTMASESPNVSNDQTDEPCMKASQMNSPQLNAAYAAMVDVSASDSPVYGANTGASFAALQEAMPDYYKKIIHPGTTSVADAYKQEVAADAQPDVSVAASPSTSGNAAAASGPRDLAQLASRLAQLERELDGMRSKNKQGDSSTALDDADDQDAQRMARARQTSTSL
ncbi:MAG: hypothetical protein PHD48_04545 [Alphaproteobacteria bacterium]|nr:hypothetical protein [Alphaproteobacteria bacterium]